MRIFITAVLIGILVDFLGAQNINESRRADFSQAGASHIVYPTLEIHLADYGGVADGVTCNYAATQAAITALNGSRGIIRFGPGIYLFKQSINLLQQIVLVGEGAANTELHFDLDGTGHCISASGTRLLDSVPILMHLTKGDRFIPIAGAHGLMAGDYVMLLFDDHQFVHDDWADRTVGQINRIVDIDIEGVYLQHEIRKDYPVAEHAFLERINPVSHVGVECLKIKRLDNTPIQTSNIFFNLAAECWVSGVESEFCNYAHVTFQRSTKCAVAGSYFHHAFTYGSGGKAYGVVLQNTSGDIKVENSIFEHLRHSVLLQAGVNGNVIAYNYSTDPYKTINLGGFEIPSDFTGDLVCHGNYPYLNLFEGNVCAYGIIDASHGANGPFNTYFRNRMERYGMQVSNSSPDNVDQNILGNEVVDWMISETGHLLYGNNLEGTPVPAGTTDPTENSQYATIPPAYFSGYEWPPTGYPRSYDEFIIPAQGRFTNGNHTVCNPINLCPDSLEIHEIGYDSATYHSAGVLRLNAQIFPFQNIKLQAADAVELMKGVSVEQDATFEVNLIGCP
ncbi:MAG: hypothetical protein HKN87_17410 [Saprospiraceae bacterium]|nr:hypothetical protein [Saprospiraceae bacterium]